MDGSLKRVAWLGDSRERVRFFPSLARREVGFELQAVQEGRDASDWKPMAIIGAGVKELRVHTEGEFRVLYVAKFEGCVYVLHAFLKKTQRISGAAVELARSRYREVLRLEGQRR